MSLCGALSVAAGSMEEAATLWGAVQAVFDAMGFKSVKVDQEFNELYRSESRTAIGNNAFDAAFEKGRSIPLAEAISLDRQIKLLMAMK